MRKCWYNVKGTNSDIAIVSRIRLIRNFKDWPFPNRLEDDKRMELLKLADSKFNDIDQKLDKTFHPVYLSELSYLQKSALLERQIINKAAFQGDKEVEIYVSEDEGISITLGETDHVRMILSRSGQELNSLWEDISYIDDYINERFPYAFHKKFGYMTAYPTNLGTGMRGYYILHLPCLSKGKNFPAIIQEMTRYGVVMKPALNYKGTNSSDLYLLYNQRTLGQSEKDIIQVLTKVANRLINQERGIRDRIPRIEMEDRAYRAYGLIRYAKKLSLEECFRYLSDIQLGISQGYFQTNDTLSIYELLLGVLPGNLQLFCDQTITEKETDEKRANYLQEFIPTFGID